jgi:hypothetical protein
MCAVNLVRYGAFEKINQEKRLAHAAIMDACVETGGVSRCELFVNNLSNPVTCSCRISVLAVHGAAPRTLIAALAAASLLALSLPTPLHAAALGGPEVRSSLNQPLRVRLPLLLREGEELAANCVRAIAPKRDDLPMAFGARASLQRDERGPYVLYSSSGAMTEPAIRGAVEIGCTDPVTREFVVLLDPLAVNPPAVAQTAPPAAAGAAASLAGNASSADAAAAPTIQARPATKIAPRQTAQTATPRVGKPPKQRKESKAPAVAVPKLADRLTLSPPGDGVGTLMGGDGGLKLSDLLSRLPQPDSAPADPAAARQLAIEQARLAAILRDEDPLAAALAKERELSDRLSTMNRDLTAVRAQVDQLTQRNRELERFAWLKWVGWGLAGLIVLAAGFFAVRAVRNLIAGRRQDKEAPWWSATQAATVRGPATTVENLYRDTIKPVPARAAQQLDLSPNTTTFEHSPADSANKIEVRELDRTSTTFMREFQPTPETQGESFSTTIVQPTEIQRAAPPTRFQPTAVQAPKPVVNVVAPLPRGPFPDTLPEPSAPVSIMPLDFDLNLPTLDLDVSAPKADKDVDSAQAGGKSASKPPAKP